MMDANWSYESFVKSNADAADFLSKSPLTFLKPKTVHKIRILPGISPDPPLQWFVGVTRHYLGDERLRHLTSSNLMKGCLCSNVGEPQFTGPSKCFVCDVIRYLETLDEEESTDAIYTSRAIIVNAYNAAEVDPVVSPTLLPKSIATQLGDLWREGTVFFHPEQGCSLYLRPIENTNMFSVVPDHRDQRNVSVPPDLLQSAVALSEVLQRLLIPYQRMKSWFKPHIVRAVDAFVTKGEIIDYRDMPRSEQAEAEDDIPFDTGPPLSSAQDSTLPEPEQSVLDELNNIINS